MNLDELGKRIITDFKWKLAFKEGMIHEDSEKVAEILFSLLSREDNFVNFLVEVTNKWNKILSPQIIYIINTYLSIFYEKQQQMIEWAFILDSEEVSSSLGECSMDELSVDKLAKCLSKSAISKKKPSKRLSKR
jgi:hypothetical protein